MTRRGLPLAFVVVLLGLGACPKALDEPARGAASRVTRTLYLGGAPVAEIVEEVAPRQAGERVRRESALLPARDDRSALVAQLDERGFVRSASYRRTGPRGGRHVELRADGIRSWLEVPGRAHRAPLPPGPVVLLDTLHLVKAEARAEVVLVDLASGEAALGQVLPLAGAVVALDERGGWIARASTDGAGRVGPGAFEEARGSPESQVALDVSPALDGAESLRGVLELGGVRLFREALSVEGPGQRVVGASPLRVRVDKELRDEGAPVEAWRRPELFVESDDAAVVAFAKQHARGSAAADALALAEAIGERIDTSRGGGPPSATSTIERWAGDCDDATALLVASLRALGHPARAVVGYRLWQGRLAPHAWAEVHTDRGWLPVDALVPGLGPFETHLRLFEGLGSPLTMGRVLGLLRPRVVDEG